MSGYAKHNGVFPLQTKIAARVLDAFRDMGPNGSTEILIPWSDFVFSNQEAWPRSYRQGLVNYRNFLAQAQPVPVSDEKVYKWSDRLTDDYLSPKTEKAYQKVIQYIEQLPLMSEKDIVIALKRKKYVSFYLKTLVYDTRTKRVFSVCRFDSIVEATPRLANKNGVIVKLGLPSLTRDERKVGAGIWEGRVSLSDFTIELPYKAKITETKRQNLSHELIHLAQQVGDHLLVALKDPFEAFTQCKAMELAAITVQTKNGPTKVRGKYVTTGAPKGRFVNLLGTYQEAPSEFYPNAYSRSAQALRTMNELGIPFVVALCLVYIRWYLETGNLAASVHMLYSAFQYAGKDPTSEELQYIRDFVYGDPVVWGQVLGYFASDRDGLVDAVFAYLMHGVDYRFFTPDQAPDFAHIVITRAISLMENEHLDVKSIYAAVMHLFQENVK
jgi:hypothetical protein